MVSRRVVKGDAIVVAGVDVGIRVDGWPWLVKISVLQLQTWGKWSSGCFRLKPTATESYHLVVRLHRELKRISSRHTVASSTAVDVSKPAKPEYIQYSA